VYHHRHHDDKMAKSSRATSVKKRRSTLKKNVFGPVEDARNERLSAKLLELASKPKMRAEMEVEQNGMQPPLITTLDSDANSTANADANSASTPANPSEEAKEEQATEGASPSYRSLSIPIPACLVHADDQLPTPPTTPTLDASATSTPILDVPAQKRLAKELLFFHLLGASTDVIGFDDNGDLQLSFGFAGS
jgi:hypothetical protein